jgi:hypothetical protein
MTDVFITYCSLLALFSPQLSWVDEEGRNAILSLQQQKKTMSILKRYRENGFFAFFPHFTGLLLMEVGINQRQS